MRLETLGLHQGSARRLARGARLACRPYVARWGDDFEDPSAAIQRSAWVLARQPIPDFVTWVPGHDGTPGPGYFLAEALAALWHIPAVDTLERTTVLPSAHAAASRPTVDEVAHSLRVSKRISGQGILVDNVIASGASISGAMRQLTSANVQIAALASISVDLAGGSHQFVYHRGRHWHFDTDHQLSSSPMPPMKACG
jgi:hypothetical protein